MTKLHVNQTLNGQKRNVKDETYNKLTLNVRKVNIAYKENSFKLSLIVVILGKGSKNFFYPILRI